MNNFTPRAQQVLALAGKEANALNHSYVGTEHILLGLLREGEGVAARVLKSLELDIERTRNEILRELDPNFTPSESDQEGEPAKKEVKTPALRAFGRDLTELARKGELDPVIGRRNEIERVIQVLCRRTKNNPVLIGEAGVGKTAIAEGLAQEIANGNVPELLHDRRVITLDLALMVAGTKYRGQFEERIKAVMDEIRRSKNVILLTDEALETAVRFSDRYITGRFLPDKAIDVMDEAGARARINSMTRPPDVKDIEKEIEEIRVEKEGAIKAQDFEKAAALRDKEKQTKEKLDAILNKWREEREEKEVVVTADDMMHIISKVTGVPLQRIEQEETQKLLMMEADLKERVVGQDEAVTAISKALRRRPYSVVLFDEIEKAHPDVMHLLLQILEDGKITDSLGRKIDFRNTIIIMTSNVGAELLKKQTVMGFGAPREGHDYASMRDKILDETKRVFKPELLNRLDEIIVFHSLEKSHLMRIVDLEVGKVKARIKAKEIEIMLDTTAHEFVIEKGYDPNYGARPMRRAVERYLEDPLAEELLRGNVKAGDRVEVAAADGKLTFHVAEPTGNATAPAS